MVRVVGGKVPHLERECNMAKHAAAHGTKMCAMTCCACNMDLKKVKATVAEAKFMCKVCGHVAAKSANLCEPTAL